MGDLAHLFSRTLDAGSHRVLLAGFDIRHLDLGRVAQLVQINLKAILHDAVVVPRLLPHTRSKLLKKAQCLPREMEGASRPDLAIRGLESFGEFATTQYG